MLGCQRPICWPIASPPPSRTGMIGCRVLIAIRLPCFIPLGNAMTAAAIGMRIAWIWGILFVLYGTIGGYQQYILGGQRDAVRASQEEMKRSFRELEDSLDEDSSEETKNLAAESKRNMEMLESTARKGEEQYKTNRILFWILLAFLALSGIGTAWRCRDKNKVGSDQAADTPPRILVDDSSNP